MNNLKLTFQRLSMGWFPLPIPFGDDELIKIHFHTNEPWSVLRYCASKGDIFDVVVENMERQEHGLKG